MRRRWIVLGVLGAGLAVAVVAGRRAAERHVRERSGTPEGPVALDCRRCHTDLGSYRSATVRVGSGHPDPVALAVTPSGDRLVVACEGDDRLAILDAATLAETARVEFPAGSLPHGVAITPDGRRAFVALRGRDRVAVVDLDTGDVRESGPVTRAPAGLALDPAGTVLVVAGSVSEDIVLIDPDTLAVRVRLAAGREPFAVAISPDGRWAHVASRLAAIHAPDAVPASEVTVVDLHAGRVASRVLLPSCHLSEGATFLPDGRFALIPVVRVRNLLPIVQVARGWVMSAGLALVPADGRGGARLLPLDSMDAYLADPAGIAVTPDGAAALVVGGGSDMVAWVDIPALLAAAGGEAAGTATGIDRLDVAADYVTGETPLAANPRAVAVGPGGRVFVTERWAGSVAALDPVTRRVVARGGLGGPSSPSAARRGDRVFHSAAVTFQGQFSCRSCHPDGHEDGLAYDFEPDGLGRNVVDNRSLLGIHGTEPFKWIGLNPDARTQCGPRFAKVLTRADPFPDEQLDDLVAYLESLPPSWRGHGSPPVTVTPAQQRGRALFLRDRAADGTPIPAADRCVTCHPPPAYTSRKLTDVGTRGPGDDFAALDVPHLRGIGRTAPYLHDGRAPTLESIWTRHDPEGRHGRVTDLNKHELNDLVEFLKGL